MDRRRVCLLTHVLRGSGVDSEIIDTVEKMLSLIDLPPLSVFRENIHHYEEAGLIIVPVSDYVFNVYDENNDRLIATIFYNNDNNYSVDTCTLDIEEVGVFVGKIGAVTMKIMAIDKVDREIKTFQRLLDNNVDTPYYDCLVKLIINMASQSRWVW